MDTFKTHSSEIIDVAANDLRVTQPTATDEQGSPRSSLAINRDTVTSGPANARRTIRPAPAARPAVAAASAGNDDWESF
ncbi:hypothetical protein D3C72_2423120 [compost metagenome]